MASLAACNHCMLILCGFSCRQKGEKQAGRAATHSSVSCLQSAPSRIRRAGCSVVLFIRNLCRGRWPEALSFFRSCTAAYHFPPSLPPIILSSVLWTVSNLSQRRVAIGKMSENKDRIPLPLIPRPFSPSVTTAATQEEASRIVEGE